MKNINNKTKKRLVVAGCLAVSAVLVVLIGNRFIPEKSADQPLSSENSQPSEVTVNTDAEKEEAVVVATPDTSQPASSDNGADSSGTDQTIQGDVSKPPEPSKEQLTNPSQKPNGEPAATNTEKPKNTPTSGSSQSGGLPGFSSVPDGGANQVTNADDMYENGNKIGNMG